MEAADQHAKRPRLDSWSGGDSKPSLHQIIDSPTHQFQQHVSYSPHSQYSSTSTMATWGESKPRSQSTGKGGVGGGAICGPGTGGPIVGHTLSVNSHGRTSPVSSEPQNFAGFQSASQPSDVDTGTANPLPPSQAMARQQLKPLQATQGNVFHDPTTFFRRPPSGSSVENRGSMSGGGAEMGSPASSNTVGPAGGYPGMQNHQLVGENPDIPTPATIQGGIILGSSQMNVVTTYPPRRKAIRAAQACDACRARKAKCDEGRPSCGFCKESQVPCVYREVPPPKQDRTLLQILDRLGRVETLLDTLNSRGETKSHTSPQQTTRKPAVPAQPQSAPAVTPVVASISKPAGMPLDEDEQLTIPYQHTTAAHKLLWWPSVRELVDPELLKQETYVIDEEQNRGTLRIYGRGEEYSGGDPNFDEESEYTAPSTENWNDMLYNTVGSEWEGDRESGSGNRGGSGEEGVIDNQVISDDHSSGMPVHGINELGLHGKLRFDRQTVQELLNSYLANIHILHPILDRATITHTVFRFADRFSASTQENSPSLGYQSGLGLGNDTASENSIPSPRSHRNNSISGKRKRSMSIPRPAPRPPHQKARTIPRTVHSALVLLVLSLGAVCLHRRPIPGPLPRSQYPSVFSNSASPFRSSETPPYSASTPPFHHHHNFHQQQQQQYLGGRSKRELMNIDAIPGLAYFSQAMDIMGALAGSNELENVQAGLLAGLYWGQLARVLDSWKWISWACMGCQILIRMKLASEKDPLRKDLVLRAFWSCLQLESDVLAELDLPPSGISRLEDSILLPSAISSPSSAYTEIVADDPLMWMYYLAQIALRKLLNRVHTALYKQDKTHLDSPRSLAIARELDYQLEAWKSHLPAPLRWESSDPPSADINAARLRAKYFGARYIIHRPFVYHALHGSGGGGNGNYHHYHHPDSPMDDQSSEDRGDITPNELEMNCRKCIEAALQSTTAFHAFDPDRMRPIITNVFGTAHAQFGNLLILQAAYQSPTLRGMIVDRILGELITKTIHWFQTLTPISPTLRRDAIILESATAKLDFPPQSSAPALQSYR